VGRLRNEIDHLKDDMNQIILDQAINEWDQHDLAGEALGPRPARPVAVKKRKCPNVPAHRALGPQTVSLVDKYGASHTLTKFPRIEGMTEDEQQERVDTGEGMLMDADILVTTENLGKLGIGMRSVTLLWSGRKKPLPNYGPKAYGREWQGESTCA